MSTDERARRIGLNEALFRQVNEQLLDVAESVRPSAEPLELICECGNLDCADHVRVDRDAYERLRSDPLLFAVAHGHAFLDVEEIVEHYPSYDVVRKRAGEAQHVAELTDPRSAS